MKTHFTDEQILSARGPKNRVSVERPYAVVVEPEFSRFGLLEDTGVIFLTNRECPFRCLMCDLWKNTLDERVPPGAIPRQIDDALAQMSPVRHLKLYNSGNFFDAQAIPTQDFPAIAERVASVRTVIVENHPLLCNDKCLRFKDLLDASCELEIAIGLETAHAEVLERLNKQMTLDDFSKAVRFLGSHGIPTRAFILLKPPFLAESDAIEWALRSIDFAFSAGVRCCCVIPTRGGNGIMETLRAETRFAPPRLESLEIVLETALAKGHGRVFADLWDVERLESCAQCGESRRRRIAAMNHTQKVPEPIRCDCRDQQRWN